MDEPKPSRDEVVAALKSILESHVFAKKETLRDLLKFLVERSLAGEELKEPVVLTEFFKRSVEADTTIVRTDASNLRGALADYYAIEGVDDEVRIGIPRRTYNAAFSYSAINRERAELDRRDAELREREREIERRHAEFERKVSEFEARQTERETAETARRAEVEQRFSGLDKKLLEIEQRAEEAQQDAERREARIVKAVRESANSVVYRLDDSPF